MKDVFERLFPPPMLKKEYQSPAEYLGDLLSLMDLRLSFALRYYHTGTRMVGDPLDRFKGMVITRSEVNDILEGNERHYDVRELEKYIEKAQLYIEARKSLSQQYHFVFDYAATLFHMTDFERFALMLALLPEVDRKYEKIIAYLQDDVTLRGPTWGLAEKLYHMSDEDKTNPTHYEKAHQAYTRMAPTVLERPAEFSLSQVIVPDKRIAEYILSGANTLLNGNGLSTFLPDENAARLPALEESVLELDRFIKNDTSNPLFIYLYGPGGSGRRTRVKRWAELTDQAAIFCDCCELAFDVERIETLLFRACREAYLNNGFMVFTNLEVMLEENSPGRRYLPLLLDTAGRFSEVVFLLGLEQWQEVEISSGRHFANIAVQPPDTPQSACLWAHYLRGLPLSEGITTEELAATFLFQPGQISGACLEARRLMLMRGGESINRDDMREGAYAQIVHQLSDKATKIIPQYSFDDIVLPDEQKQMLLNACNQLKYKDLVYENWGFNRRITYGRGISMLFAGPPGTGKTMAAQVVAKQMGLVIYKVDLSQISSKYIGETEKNLAVVFAEARKSNAVLFFDETDALLGKRTEVKDAHDKYANFETSYLLQKMEEYDGITIMSTNLLENIDSAFFRRISYIVHFPFPDVTERRHIWQGMFPDAAPLDKSVDMAYLAANFEIAGGNIKNTALTASFLAAASGEKISMRHILTALKYELTKQGKVLVKDDFGEYAFMVFPK